MNYKQRVWAALRGSSVKSMALLGVVVGMTACSSPIYKMSAAEAVKQGNQQFFTLPSYRMDMEMKLENMNFEGGNKRDVESISRFVNGFVKNFSFGMTSVVDNEQDRYQIIPNYRYEAKNVMGMVRFPIVYEARQRLLYADASSFSWLVTRPEDQDKYMRYSLATLPIPANAEKRVGEVLRRYSNLPFDGVTDSEYQEVALTEQDRALGGVRKVQVVLKPKQFLHRYQDVTRDLAAAVFGFDANDVTDESRGDTDGDDGWARYLSADSKDTVGVAFNRQGQIVAMDTLSDYHLTDSDVDESTSDKPTTVNLRAKTSFRISEIGRAQMIDPPTAENSVDGMESFQGSFLKSIFSSDKDEASNDDKVNLELKEYQPPKKPSKTTKKRKQRRSK